MSPLVGNFDCEFAERKCGHFVRVSVFTFLPHLLARPQNMHSKKLDYGQKKPNEENAKPTVRKKELTSNVKNLGRKARARLDEERNKRPEIVRCEVSTDPRAQNVGEAATTRLEPLVPKTKRKATGCSLGRKQQSRSTSTKFATILTNVDSWVPDTSALPRCSRDTRSNVVLLHGLPIGTTPQQLLRFFSGLNPERVFLLPECRIQLKELDADCKHNGGDNMFIERNSFFLRVGVKFHAAPTAELAAKRSGEILSLSEKDRDEGRPAGAAIAVVQIAKQVAAFLLRHMAFDAQPDVALERTMKDVHDRLPSTIPAILWSAAARKLHLIDSAGFDNRLTSLLRLTTGNSDREHTSEVMRYRRTLVVKQKALRSRLPFPCVDCFDPELNVDPIIRLSSSANECLIDELNQLDNILARSERWVFFQKARLQVNPSPPGV